MTKKRKRPVTKPGAGYSQALAELYGNSGRDYPPPHSGCKGPLPVGNFLAQAVKRIPQRRAS